MLNEGNQIHLVLVPKPWLITVPVPLFKKLRFRLHNTGYRKFNREPLYHTYYVDYVQDSYFFFIQHSFLYAP